MHKFKILLLNFCSIAVFSQSNPTLNVPSFESLKIVEDSLQTFKIKGAALFEQSTTVVFEPSDKKTKVYYRFVSSDADEKVDDFKIYKKPITLNKSGQIEAYSKNRNTINDLVKFNIYKKPNQWTIENISQSSVPYNVSQSVNLIDGQYADTENLENGWLGYNTPTFEVIVDRRTTEELTHLSANFLQDANKGIFLPTKVEFYLSNNRKSFIKIGTLENKTDVKDNTVATKKYELDILPTTARFVKIVAYNYCKLPKNNPSNRTTSYLLIDEIESK